MPVSIPNTVINCSSGDKPGGSENPILLEDSKPLVSVAVECLI